MCFFLLKFYVIIFVKIYFGCYTPYVRPCTLQACIESVHQVTQCLKLTVMTLPPTSPARTIQTIKTTIALLLLLLLVVNWCAVRLVHLADERVSVGASGVVPAVACFLVEQHTMHRRASVRLPVSPSRVWHRAHSTLLNPHPTTTASHVTSARPPTFRVVVLWHTHIYSV